MKNKEKTFDVIQHQMNYMVKIPNIFGIEERYLNIINAIFNKSTINTLPLREKLKNSLISGTR